MMMAEFFNSRAAVFVDVDNTLILWTPAGPQLNTSLVQRIKESQSDSVEFVLWSRRGRRYAQGIAEQYELTDLFVAIVGKPTAMFDDQGVDWLENLRIYPPTT